MAPWRVPRARSSPQRRGPPPKGRPALPGYPARAWTGVRRPRLRAGGHRPRAPAGRAGGDLRRGQDAGRDRRRSPARCWTAARAACSSRGRTRRRGRRCGPSRPTPRRTSARGSPGWRATCRRPRGLVAIVSGGTSDGPVVREVAGARASCSATEVVVHRDAGVAGLHRLEPALPGPAARGLRGRGRGLGRRAGLGGRRAGGRAGDRRADQHGLRRHVRRRQRAAGDDDLLRRGRRRGQHRRRVRGGDDRGADRARSGGAT